MSKARARERAKAKTANKSRKPKKVENKDGGPESKVRPGQFDAKSFSMRNISGSNANNPAGMKRGSARSR